MNTEERLRKLLEQVNAPQTVEERLDAIERTLAMAFEVQAAQQKLILMLSDQYGTRVSVVDGSAKNVEELTALVRHLQEIIGERDARIDDLECEIADANDISGVSRFTSNTIQRAIFDQMLVHDFAQYGDTVSDWKAYKKDGVFHCRWFQRSTSNCKYSYTHDFNINGLDAIAITSISKLLDYWRLKFIDIQNKIDEKGGAE